MKILLVFSEDKLDDQQQEPTLSPSSISTQLHLAASLNSTSEVRKLFQNHNFTSSDLGSALVDASRSGNKEIVKVLLDTGADVNWTGSDEDSALMAACRGGQREVARLLLERGATVELVHLYGKVLREVLDEIVICERSPNGL
ncbi:hypothetical protein IFR04_002533 [Cadophora malorum]|uniref:Ankyrin n=1 Tax=Cadophora malorum TaxID=108018 RepID=A0A8H7WGC5_9HELO|nr:hypothetical protein IFR04_002533 [Cadophora malorum]